MTLHLAFYKGMETQIWVLFPDWTICTAPSHRHFEATAGREIVRT